MTISQSDIVAALTQFTSDKDVMRAPADMRAFLEEPRGRFHQPATAVVTPRNVAQVQAIAKWANDNNVAIVPQGGNTGLVGGQVPLLGHEVILSLKHLNAVRSVDAVAGHLTVEAGATLLETQEAALGAGAMFPLSIASEGSACIGGVLSSNAGGIQVLAYGTARELCLGVEAVLADGRLYQGLNALRKDNTGYDLRDLLVGAEGTLGIITAATLKLYPSPIGHDTALVAVSTPGDALELFNLLRKRAGRGLTAFELLPRIGIDFQLKHKMLERDPSGGISPWYALAEISLFEGDEAGALEHALADGYAQDLVGDASVLAQSEGDRHGMWRMREQLSECQGREGASIKHDVSVPIAAVPELVTRGTHAAQKIMPNIRPVLFGHMGDGNLHFNFSQPEGADAKEFMAGAGPIHDAVYEVVLSLGGSVSAEHGIGQLKTELLNQVKDPVAMEMMRGIKQTLDPNGILNPGKLLG